MKIVKTGYLIEISFPPLLAGLSTIQVTWNFTGDAGEIIISHSSRIDDVVIITRLTLMLGVRSSG